MGCAIRNALSELPPDVEIWRTGNAHAQRKIGDIFGTGHPIYVMFGFRVGFSWVGGSNGSTSSCTKSKKRPHAIFENFE